MKLQYIWWLGRKVDADRERRRNIELNDEIIFGNLETLLKRNVYSIIFSIFSKIVIFCKMWIDTSSKYQNLNINKRRYKREI